MATAPVLKRDAFPHDVLFFEADGIYWLHGRDLKRAKSVLGFCNEGQDSIGFDAESAYYYIRTLLEQGMSVGVARGTSVKTITLQGSGDPTKVKSRAIWLAPVLLYGHKELSRLIRVHTRKHSHMASAIERFRQELTIEVGTLYVFQIGVDEYDVDWSLTRIPREVVEALSVAAHLEGRKLKCRLVEPKGRREKRRSVEAPKVVVSEPVTYGQLRLV